MSDSPTNTIDHSEKARLFSERTVREVRDIVRQAPNDSAAVAKAKDQFREQITDWGKDLGKDLFKETLHDFGFGKDATASEGATATGLGRLAGPVILGAKVMGDVANIYHAQANQAYEAAGLPEQSLLQSLAIGYNLIDPPPLAGVIDFTKTGSDLRSDLAALAKNAHQPMLSPLERAQNYLQQQKEESSKRLADYNQHAQDTDRLGQLIQAVGLDSFRPWKQRGEALQLAYYAAFHRHFEDVDLPARMKEVQHEYDRQRDDNNRKFNAFHKSNPEFAKEGLNRFVKESLDDFADDLRRKRDEHQPDIAGKRALEKMRQQNVTPDSPDGKDLLAKERGRLVEEQQHPSAIPPTVDVGHPQLELNRRGDAGAQATRGGNLSEDILNRQLEEQTKIAVTLDEMNRKGLTVVTGVGMEGL